MNQSAMLCLRLSVIDSVTRFPNLENEVEVPNWRAIDGTLSPYPASEFGRMMLISSSPKPLSTRYMAALCPSAQCCINTSRFQDVSS
jgi:hypothetical protein